VARVFIHQIEHELDEKFVTASGPGGQNVNKVATAVQLRFNVMASPAFSEDQKALMRRQLASKLTNEGELVIFVQTHRSQPRNREEARERLIGTLEKALTRPKYRVATKPTRASKERRLTGKSIRSKVKKERSRTSDE
jgi:ribosome-associated protein